MPDLMFTYRAGAFFARVYAPDITLGMMTSEEAADVAPIRNVTPGTVPLDPFASPVVESLPEPEANNQDVIDA
jgi:hypothetical protein